VKSVALPHSAPLFTNHIVDGKKEGKRRKELLG
jgi:hypothetical protein